ncbi:MAG TPA: putative porin [Steroidobacteraceae bacterium]|nr:putative porin [Steroidobacteraceae bacterium]
MLRRCLGAAVVLLACGAGAALAESTASPADARPAFEPFADFRLREENNFGDRDGRSNERTQLRLRGGARYALSNSLTVGARITMLESSRLIGVSDTASTLADSTDFRIDYAYLRFKQDDLTVFAGRFPNPFFRTELQVVWDNEFNPQGAAATYQLIHAVRARPGLDVTALYYPLQYDWIGRESTLTGMQWVLKQASGGSRYRLGIGYFDYELHGEPNVEHEDYVRGNVVVPGLGFVSDFKLLDVIGDVMLEPWGEKWPVQIVTNYVHNRGATTGEDAAYAVDAYVGHLEHSGNWRLNYAYARVEADAVFVAFSQDNTSIASNYRWHSLGVEYALGKQVTLSGIWYRYRPDDARYAGRNQADDWLNRVRFEVNVTF